MYIYIYRYAYLLGITVFSGIPYFPHFFRGVSVFVGIPRFFVSISATVPQAHRACLIQYRICNLLKKKGVEDFSGIPRFLVVFSGSLRFCWDPPFFCIYIRQRASGTQSVFDSMQNLQSSEEGNRRFSSFKGKQVSGSFSLHGFFSTHFRLFFTPKQSQN